MSDNDARHKRHILSFRSIYSLTILVYIYVCSAVSTESIDTQLKKYVYVYSSINSNNSRYVGVLIESKVVAPQVTVCAIAPSHTIHTTYSTYRVHESNCTTVHSIIELYR